MPRPWEADASAEMRRRVGRAPLSLGVDTAGPDCPDIWELDNGDFAVIGREATDAYRDRLPPGVSMSDDERLVVIPRSILTAAKPDIPDT
ncbi:hypothetical protein [Streptomonospora litoralis]|uniref:Uncharacterized protein n=1 Tax=Streptomonospora litoralis TaxID=2498135 RepID=A0A4V0ZKC3_9ACTN|nr:hypothetical protein [Streptomonospora litoralis]QBI56482.1 hypothetical protein EKD16_23680 [Streptomonospora litoralis]